MSNPVQQPRSRALFGGAPWPKGVLLFKSPDEFCAALFGPADHDAHVRKWHQHARLIEDLAEYDARYRAVQQHVNEMIARERAL